MRIEWKQKIVEKLNQYGWDIPFFAKRLGDTPSRAQAIIDTEHPSLNLIILVSETLGVSLQYFNLSKPYVALIESGMSVKGLAVVTHQTPQGARELLRRIEKGTVQYSSLLRFAAAVGKKPEYFAD